MWGMTRTRQLHINAMKSLLSVTAIAVGLVVLGATFISAETFTDRSVDPTKQRTSNFQILVAQKDEPAAKVE
jgi:hypothetical protein